MSASGCVLGAMQGILLVVFLLFSSRKVETWPWARMRVFNRHEVGRGKSII